MSGNRRIPSSVLKDSEVVASGGSSVSSIRGWAAPECSLDFLSSLSLASDTLNSISKACGLLCVCHDLHLQYIQATQPEVASKKTTTEINTTAVLGKGITMFISGLSFLALSLFTVEIPDILVCLLGLGKLAEVTFIYTVSEGAGAILVTVPSTGVAVECLYENDIKDEDVAKLDRYVCDTEILFIVPTAVSDGKQIDGQGSSNLHFFFISSPSL